MTKDAALEGLEVLTTSDCLRLPKSGCVGRVGFMDVGQPRVLPVNYTADDDGSVVFRTAHQSILTMIGARPATFEIDGFDERHRTGWSVCGAGRRAGDHHGGRSACAPTATTERHHVGARAPGPLVRRPRGRDHRAAPTPEGMAWRFWRDH